MKLPRKLKKRLKTIIHKKGRGARYKTKNIVIKRYSFDEQHGLILKWGLRSLN